MQTNRSNWRDPLGLVTDVPQFTSSHVAFNSSEKQFWLHNGNLTFSTDIRGSGLPLPAWSWDFEFRSQSPHATSEYPRIRRLPFEMEGRFGGCSKRRFSKYSSAIHDPSSTGFLIPVFPLVVRCVPSQNSVAPLSTEVSTNGIFIVIAKAEDSPSAHEGCRNGLVGASFRPPDSRWNSTPKPCIV